MASLESNSKSSIQKKFYEHFQAEVAALQQQIDRLASTSIVGAERVDATEHCLAGVARLSNETNEAIPDLPAHDQRTYSESIKSLKTRLDDVRAASQPKPKFSFKSRQKNNSAISLTEAAELAKKSKLKLSGDRSGKDPSSTSQSSRSETPAPYGDDAHESGEEAQYPALRDMREAASIRKPSFSQAKSVTISNHSNLHIILPSSAAHATTSGTLSKLKRCVLDMSVPTTHGQPFAGLSVKNIKQSLIVGGRVSGPIHITGMEAVVLVVTCRQFRMHDCKNCDVYLYSTSKPIIEHCTGIRFAPIPPYHDPQVSSSSNNNVWDQVEDFNWLRSEPSPHWQILPVPERVGEDIWTDMVPGGPNHGLTDILKAVGVEH